MRRKRKYTREFEPDAVYDSVEVTRFVNKLMSDGRKAAAEKIMYDALLLVEERTKLNPAEALKTAIENVSPTVEVASRRVGGANYQVPREVRPTRRFALALRWLIGAAQSKSGKPMKERLAEELILATQKEGAAMKKRSDMHRMAEANKAFAHFKW
ncbi:MAG: 30S ribosomal protein S7 [Patescibacteria group bacterium]|nr:30S ribosomal protein S7 [Patescibacteria group bacterium]MDE2437799.1 30S ribosomal protein S7 [Patescibacteria group bacterium]